MSEDNNPCLNFICKEISFHCVNCDRSLIDHLDFMDAIRQKMFNDVLELADRMPK